MHPLRSAHNHHWITFTLTVTIGKYSSGKQLIVLCPPRVVPSSTARRTFLPVQGTGTFFLARGRWVTQGLSHFEVQLFQLVCSIECRHLVRRVFAHSFQNERFRSDFAFWWKFPWRRSLPCAGSSTFLCCFTGGSHSTAISIISAA